jgi:uncharacterized membrane protein
VHWRVVLLLGLPALVVTAGIAASPLLLHAGDAPLAVLARLAYAPACHQSLERSFMIDGAPLAVCARCTGGYLAFTAGVLLAVPLLWTELRRVPVRAWLVGLVPMALDWALDVAGLVQNSMASRTVTGAVAGFAMAMIAVRGMDRRVDVSVHPVTDEHSSLVDEDVHRPF